MTVTPQSVSAPDPTSPLSNPSHAELHADHLASIASLDGRVGTVESALLGASSDLQQARRVSNTWVVAGTVSAQVGTYLLPLLWNLTSRAATYEAAKASVTTAPDGAALVVDICVGSDPQFVSADSIFVTPLTIPDGQNVSPTVLASSGGFITPPHNPNVFLQVVVLQVGSIEPGSDLTVQLNRLL